MARRWRFNPPPNWPTMPQEWTPAPDWRPDPGWGHLPDGWTLWVRESRAQWLARHKRATAGAVTAVLAAAGLAAPVLVGTVAAAGERTAAPTVAAAHRTPAVAVRAAGLRGTHLRASRSGTRPTTAPTGLPVPHHATTVAVAPRPASAVAASHAAPPDGAMKPVPPGLP